MDDLDDTTGVYAGNGVKYGTPRSGHRSTVVAEKLEQHFTKCMDYHQIKTIIIPIDFTMSSYYLKKVKMTHSLIACTFIYI